MQIVEPETLLLVARSGILRHTLPVAILKVNATINQDIKAISLYAPDFAEFVYNFLKGSENSILLKYTKSGTTVENINFDEFKKIVIPLPPLFEQNRIVSKIKELLSFVDTIESDKSTLLTAIDQTKAKILDLAIRGKLVPQDPNDESASVLLERIRAEKEELIKQGKIKRDKKESVIFKGEDNSYYETIGSKTACIDDEIPFELPEGWGWCRLLSLASVISKGTTPKNKTKAYSSNEVNYLRVENINNDGTINQDGMLQIDNGTHNIELKRSILYENDLLITIAGTLGKTATVRKSNLPMNTNQAIAFIRPININFIYEDFIRYAICSEKIQDKLISKTKVTSIPNLTLEIISGCIIPFPPLNEQKRIADKIDQLFSTLDTISASLD